MSTLFLLPTPLSEEDPVRQTVPLNAELMRSCKCFIVEELKTARRFLKAIDKSINIDGLTFLELNEHTPDIELVDMLKMIEQHEVSILMSEAGCPGIADPGAALIRMAHGANIKVVPLIGPSSIILAVMSSGLNGQSFAFNGYLPKDKIERAKKIKALERLGMNQSQWFIETPYRNVQLFEELVSSLGPDTRLCVAANLTGHNEFISTRTVAAWKKQKPDINKIPCVFGIGA